MGDHIRPARQDEFSSRRRNTEDSQHLQVIFTAQIAMQFLGVVALFAVVFFEVAAAAPAIGLVTDSDISLSSACLLWLPWHRRR